MKIFDFGPDVEYCIHYLPSVEEFMAKHDKAYDQVSHPEAGTTGAAPSKDDALGNPGRDRKSVV